MGSVMKIFLSFSHYKSMGAIYWHGGHFYLKSVTNFTNFQSPFNTRLQMKFEEIWPRGFRGGQFKGSMGGQTEGWTDGPTDG